MGLKAFFSRWSRGEDARAVERAEDESRMTPVERAADHEDYEAKKDDIASGFTFPGAEAEEAAADDLESS